MSDLNADSMDTVVVCIPDAVGRLIGKQIGVDQWAQVREAGMPMPNFHLATDLELRPIHGLDVTGFHTGFPNGIARPDISTLRRIPWDESTALVLADAYTTDGSIVEEAPRATLAHQVRRLAEHGLLAQVATELEFYAFATSYADALEHGYRDLQPVFHRSGDHDPLMMNFLRPFLSEIRRAMSSLGWPAIATLGEGGIGQIEMNFGHGDPILVADNHVLFKYTTKALAASHGLSATFMAKYSHTQPGSGCHIHLSLWSHDGDPLHAHQDDAAAMSDVASQFLGGVLKYAPDFTLLYAPYVNSYRRLRPGSWAPDRLTWGYDNRTVLVRILGTGPAMRLELRLPGADANPYVSLAALLASGISGLDEHVAPPPPTAGSGYDSDCAGMVPRDLDSAISRFRDSDVARKSLGDAVHRHLVARAVDERESAAGVVTDWDRRHGFENS